MRKIETGTQPNAGLKDGSRLLVLNLALECVERRKLSVFLEEVEAVAKPPRPSALLAGFELASGERVRAREQGAVVTDDEFGHHIQEAAAFRPQLEARSGLPIRGSVCERREAIV